jgi:predicted AlkP superfamily phosphohydrolase/phosphomutase
MVHFQQTDWIQHKLWTYIEQGCKTPEDHTSNVEATRNCYRKFDACVGRLLHAVESISPTVIILSDHGFGRLMGNIHPNFYLKQWGYLSLKPEAEDSLKGVKDLFRRSKSKTVQNLYRSVTQAKNHIRRDAKDHESWADNAGAVLGSRGASWDWSKTKAACIYAYQMGFVYVNGKGRGPMGIVEPGKEYEAIVSDLIARFRDLRHQTTGEKLLADVLRGSEAYPPADNGILVPDLVLIPAKTYGFSFSITDAPPMISEEGTHRHDGVLLMNGDSVAPAAVDFRPTLIDIAPTILHLLGLPVPTDMDGRVLEEVLGFARPVQYEAANNSLSESQQHYSETEEEIVAQRLKGLGYLD